MIWLINIKNCNWFGFSAGIAKWLEAEGFPDQNYVISQGTKLGRKGRIFVKNENDKLWIGGQTVPCIRGTVTI